LFGLPTLVFVLMATRLPEPLRGTHERRAAGASEELANTEEEAPSFAEAWRILWQIKALRRLWISIPFLAISLIGLGSLLNLYYEDVFHLNEVQRGVIAAVAAPGQFVGILIMTPWLTRIALRDPGLLLKALAVVGVVVGAGIAGFSVAPNVQTAVAINILISLAGAVLVPGIYAVFSFAIP